MVKRERRFLTAIAIPLGLICAAGIALIAVPGYWSWGDNLRSAVVVSLLTYGTVLIATRKPMAMAGKVSAIEAIRATAYSRQQGPSVSRQLHRRLTMPRLAWMNFSRNRKKAFITTLSLGLTGILLSRSATHLISSFCPRRSCPPCILRLRTSPAMSTSTRSRTATSCGGRCSAPCPTSG